MCFSLGFVPLIFISRGIVIAHFYFMMEGFPLAQWFPNFSVHLEGLLKQILVVFVSSM